ncbi:MAG: hypothetical protein ACRER2_03015 [Methylococcales bacterium]
MNIEQYFSASRAIHEEMAQIATTTGTMAVAQSAHPGNPQFVGLMRRHATLVAQFQDIHRQFVASNPHYAA